MTKNEFILKIKNSCLNMDHISKRKLDYKYHEYLLFKVLKKYSCDDFKILGVPEDLNINFFSSKDGYNINKRTHVTLNYQLYKLYECGYYNSEDILVESTRKIVSRYNSGMATIKELDSELRKIRMEYLKEIKELIN